MPINLAIFKNNRTVTLANPIGDHMEDDLQRANCLMLGLLYNSNELLTPIQVRVLRFRDSHSINADPTDNSSMNLNRYLLAGRLLARGVGMPSCTLSKKRKDGGTKTAASLEVDKITRRPSPSGATVSSPASIVGKLGNPNRSASLIGWAGGVYANAGWLIRIIDYSKIKQVFSGNKASGRGKYKRDITGMSSIHS